MKWVLPWLDPWALGAGTRDFCPALATLVGRRPSTKYCFFPHLTLFHFIFVPIAQQAGQAVVPSRLPHIVCLCLTGVDPLLSD
jgi:hypothetical protein